MMEVSGQVLMEAFMNTQKVESMLAKAGIKLLHNQRESIYLKGQSLTIAGVGDLWSKDCRPDQCLPKNVLPK